MSLRLMNEVYEISQAILDCPTMDGLLRASVKSVINFGFVRAGIFMVEGDEVKGKVGTDLYGNHEDIGSQKFPISGNSNFSDILRGKIEYYYTTNAANDLPYDNKKYLPNGIRFNVVVPLKFNNKIIGFISVDNCSDDRGISQDDINLLCMLANMISMAIKYKELELKLGSK